MAHPLEHSLRDYIPEHIEMEVRFGNDPCGLQKTVEKINQILDVSLLENILVKKDFSTIIHSPELFWLAFCKAATIPYQSDGIVLFQTTLKNKSLTIMGIKKTVKEINKLMEELRQLLAKNYDQKKETTLIPIYVSHYYVLREKADLIDITDSTSREPNFSKDFFNDCVRPTIPRLVRSLGATCSEIILKQSYIYEPLLGILKEEIKSLKVEWSHSFTI